MKFQWRNVHPFDIAIRLMKIWWNNAYLVSTSFRRVNNLTFINVKKTGKCIKFRAEYSENFIKQKHFWVISLTAISRYFKGKAKYEDDDAVWSQMPFVYCKLQKARMSHLRVHWITLNFNKKLLKFHANFDKEFASPWFRKNISFVFKKKKKKKKS